MKSPLKLRPNRQTCKRCGAVDKINFHVSDCLWEKVSGQWVNNVLCLACFDDLAQEKNIDYAKHIHSIYFAGDQGCFEFKAINVLDRKEFCS